MPRPRRRARNFAAKRKKARLASRLCSRFRGLPELTLVRKELGLPPTTVLRQRRRRHSAARPLGRGYRVRPPPSPSLPASYRSASSLFGFPNFDAARRSAASPLHTAIPALRFPTLARAPVRKRTTHVRPMRAEAAFASSRRSALECGGRSSASLRSPVKPVARQSLRISV